MINRILKDKRILLIIGVVCVAAAAVYRFSPNLGELFRDDALFQKQIRLDKYRKLVDSEKKLTTALSSAKKVYASANRMLLQADTPAIAAVEIQERVQQIAAGQNLEIESIRFLDAVERESEVLKGYTAIPIQFSVDASTRDMARLMYDLETSDKLLSVKKTRFRVRSQGGERLISATIVVWGYMKETGETRSGEHAS